MVVLKKDGKWRVCIDYTDLNEACPKDSFPLPCIDQSVDFAAGKGILSFLNAFFRYHHIPMHPPDAEKKAFITPQGLYCYNVMPFGLKNVGAIYQRLVTEIFRLLLGKSLAEAETRYTRLDQVTLALRVGTKKLRPSFQAHPIIVLTNLPCETLYTSLIYQEGWPDGRLS